ncbi:MAG: hypothetical protein HY290_24660 [Planctomycetia bacterium]|nr:hypothetical protein [Planctomycetia bacterium]
MRTIESNRTLERDLVRLLKGLIAAAPICLASLVSCCAAVVIAVDQVTSRAGGSDWSFALNCGLWIGAPASFVVSLCALSVPRDLKLRVLLGGGVITGLLAAWYLYRMMEAMAAC